MRLNFHFQLCYVVLLASVVLALMGYCEGADTSHSSSSESESSHGDGHSSSHSSSSHSSSSHSSSVNVFVLGEFFDYDTFILLLSVLGGTAMILELVLDKYEEWLQLEGDTFQSTLKNKIVRELMTLGVVSFVLFLVEPLVTHGTLFYIFEFAHYVIFFIAIFTVLQLVMLGASTYPIKYRWDSAAYRSEEEVLKGYTEAIAANRWHARVPLLGRVSLDLFHLGEEWRWVDCVQFHLARSIFIRQFGRRADFDFARYACLVTDRLILSLANPPLRSWMMLIALHWLCYFVTNTFESLEGQFLQYLSWFIFGLILMGLEMVLLFACMLGMRRICVKLGADKRDTRRTLDKVLKMIWVAPRTQTQQSRKKRKDSADMTVYNMSGFDKLMASSSQQQQQLDGSSGGLAPIAGGVATIAEEKNAGSDNDSVGGTSTADLFAEQSQMAAASVDVSAHEIPEITMKDAFLISSTKVHIFVIEALMMLNSYYLAFFAVYHIASAVETGVWYWIILIPMPVLCGTLVAYRRVLPLFSLLCSVVVLRAAVVADVEGEAEETNKLRRKLVLRIQDVIEKEFKACTVSGEIPQDHCTATYLISRWSKNNEKELSYKELETGLAEYGLVLSRRQRRELLRLADPDRSGTIDVKELSDFLYDVEVAIGGGGAAAVGGGARVSLGRGRSDVKEEEVGLEIERLIHQRTSRRNAGRSGGAAAVTEGNEDSNFAVI